MAHGVAREMLTSFCNLTVGYVGAAVALGSLRPMWAVAMVIAYLIRVVLDVTKR